MANTKHYVITAITLGAIGAVSALAIGLTNFVTAERIKTNEQNKINSGIVEIFGENAKISLDQEFENEEYKYIERVYEVSSSDDTQIGYAFRTTGSNNYGKISLLVGFNLSSEFIKMEVVANEQTYAQTLVDNYIVPLNGDASKIDDVSCGATYGAKLVRDMINEAKQASESKPWRG